MKYKSVEIHNFGTIGSVDLPLQNLGLVLVTGINKDTPKASSNGAGKSLLLDAFCWCLWGKTVRDDKDDDVVNSRVGKNCKVKVVFEEAGKTFTVIRYRKHEDSKKPNDLELYLNDVDLSSANMKSTQEVINGIVGLTFETFCALMPGSGKNASQMTDVDIKELLENMLQITALARARVETDKRIKALNPQLSKLKQEISSLETALQQETSRLKTYRAEEKDYTTKQTEKQEGLKQDEQLLLVDRTRGANVIQQGALAREELTRVELVRSEQLLEYNSAQNSSEQIKENMRETRLALYNKRSEAVGELNVHTNSLNKINTLGTICTECKQQIDKAHHGRLHADADSLCTQLTTRISKYDELLKGCDVEEAAYLAPVEVLLSSLDTKLALLDASITNLTEVIMKAGTAEIHRLGIESAISALQKQLQDLSQEKNPYTGWIVQAENQVREFEESRVVKKEELVVLECSLSHLEFWKDAFSVQGIRSFILDNVTPVLNERAKYYCDLLTDGEMSIDFSTQSQLKSGETREKFSITIEQKHGGKSYKSNSKGERQRANLAIAFSLSDLAELHSSKSLDFRFLDEPFEGIDESGTDAVIALLQEQRSRYPTVFVVTHQSHFKDVFPREIVMVKQAGTSRLEV